VQFIGFRTALSLDGRLPAAVTETMAQRFERSYGRNTLTIEVAHTVTLPNQLAAPYYRRRNTSVATLEQISDDSLGS
jgi:hypothetical protein